MRTVPSTPPPPPFPPVEPRAEFNEPGRFYNRKTIDASEWEAAQAKAAEKPAHQVLVHGLPSTLLSDLMFNAILQQSGISESVRCFKASSYDSGSHGQVLISLESADAAHQCQYHFQGRTWGSAEVSAEILPSYEAQQEDVWESIVNSVVSTALLPDAPEFVPLESKQASCNVSARSWLEEATAELQKQSHEHRHLSSYGSSNASTRDEESSGDEASRMGPAKEQLVADFSTWPR